MTQLKHLFSPMRIGRMEVANRVVMPAMGSHQGHPDGSPSEATIGYYEARAAGGAGLIVVEIATVHETSKRPDVLALDSDDLIPAWKKLADAIHAQGGKGWPQIGHLGRQMHALADGSPPIAASPIPCPLMRALPREMTHEDIEVVVSGFGDAARRAQEAGFDGVEVHGAHGYLICNFLSPWSNKRTDEYGGSVSNRLRFALEVLADIRAKCGGDFPVGIRLSATEMFAGGLVPEEVEVMASVLARAGVDAVSITRGSYGSFRWIVPPASAPPAVLAPYTERLKKVVDIPVMVAHRIQDPVVADHIVAHGQADLVCMGRALIADPDLPNKARAGRFDDIIPCIACNLGCLERIFIMGKHVTCTLNRTVGEEKEMALSPAPRKKKVLVAGAGPGGLEAARVAALRGHEVILCEKSDHVGGQLAISAVPPTKQEYAKAIHYLHTQVKKAGVRLELSRAVTPEVVEELQPDVLIVATGAAPAIPASIPGADRPNVVTAHDVLAGKAPVGRRIVILGAGEVGCETADYAGEQGARQITLLEMRKAIALDMIRWNREFLLERLQAHGVRILTLATVKEILDDGVVFTRDGKEESIRGADSVVLAMGARPVNDLPDKVMGKVPEVHVLGDAVTPRRALEAIHEAYEIAREV